jgi:hypothetical protein
MSGREVRRRGARYWTLAIVVVAVGAAASLAWRFEASRPSGGTMISAGTPVAVAARREIRPTLDPGRFVGKAALAHQVAREIPDVLDQLYCYCECDKHVGHKSLLSCYTDGHAAT